MTTVTDESGSLISLQLGRTGAFSTCSPASYRDYRNHRGIQLRVPIRSAAEGEEDQGALGQVTDQAGQAVQGAQDTAGGAGQAQDAAGQVPTRQGRPRRMLRTQPQGAASKLRTPPEGPPVRPRTQRAR